MTVPAAFGTVPAGYTVASRGWASPGVFRTVVEQAATGRRMVSEVLMGEAANRHLGKKSKVNKIRKAIERGHKKLRDRGTPIDAGSPVVSRTYEQPAETSGAAQDSASTSGGELIVWSSNTSNNKWRGTIYMEDYSDGHWRVFDGEMKIKSTSSHGVNWVDYIDGGFHGQGGGPIEIERVPSSSPDEGRVALVAAVELIGTGEARIAPVRQDGGDEGTTRSNENDFKKFLWCILRAIVQSGAACWSTGPLFWACAFLIHSVRSVACALSLSV